VILYIRVPIFDTDDDEVLSRFETFKGWLSSEGEKQIPERFRAIEDVNAEVIGPDQTLRITTAIGTGGARPLAIRFPKGTLIGKGLAVRLHLVHILDRLDRQGIRERANAYFLLIDGSGAFAFSNIFLVLDRLLGQGGCNVVLGRRPRENQGMSPWRVAIEEFEKFMLIRRHGREIRKQWLDRRTSSLADLPDLQAGCWGIRLSVARALALTASGYGLEFDLATSAIQGGERFAFTDLLAMERRARSTFPPLSGGGLSTQLEKLEFIRHKLGYSAEQCQKLLKAYLKETRQPQLPEEYIDAIRKLPVTAPGGSLGLRKVGRRRLKGTEGPIQ
jgi:hypothetical protein